jgi:lipopolysaccharide/colanic/teichoic acid biosynthesis glycosyltransferase
MNMPIKSLPLSARSSKPLAPSLEQWRLRIYLLMLVADLILVQCAFSLAGAVYHQAWPAEFVRIEAQLLLPVFATIALYQSAYSINSLSDVKYAIRRGLLALLVSSALLIFVTFYTKSTASFSRGTFTLALLFIAIGMVGLRIFTIRVFRRTWGPSVTNVLLIEDGGPEVNLRNALRISAEQHDIVADVTDPHRLDRLGRYLQNMDRVVVSCPVERRLAWAFVLRAAGVRGEVVSGSLQELAPTGMEVDGECISLIVSAGPLGLRARAMKRAFDTALAGAALVAFLPVMLIAGLEIKLGDGGPVFFVQRRLGRGNRFFQMLKFRSMRVDKADADGNRSASLDDDRITPIGRILRRTSIDELPQLINVVRGDTSMFMPTPVSFRAWLSKKSRKNGSTMRAILIRW